MKYKVLDINNYDEMVDDYLEGFSEEFNYASSKKMVMNRKSKFKKFIKPVLINELEHQLNEYPEILEENFENKGNGIYVSKAGVKVIIEEKEE